MVIIYRIYDFINSLFRKYDIIFLIHSIFKPVNRKKNMEKETFYERLERILEQNNVQKKDLAEKCGISQNGISTWKVTGTIPRADIAIKIAKHLNVSVEYLITGELPDIDDSNTLAYQVAGLSPQKQQVVKALIEALEIF